MQTIKWMILWKILGLSAGIFGQTIELQFFENECYGDVIIGLEVDSGTWCLAYPDGAHFVETGDGCGEGYCLVMEYYDSGACDVNLGYREVVGSGCYNINTGFQPVAYTANCLVCD